MKDDASPLVPTPEKERQNDYKPGPECLIVYALYAIGAVAALWQHGHPLFTFEILCGIPLAACLSYAPRRFFGAAPRAIGQTLVVLGSIAWVVYRCEKSTPLDIALVESIALLGLNFAFTRDPAKGYGFQFLISGLLLLYGALLPRDIYLYCFMLYAPLAAISLYLTRPLALASDLSSRPPLLSQFRWNWRHMIVHAVLAFLIAIYVYSIIPIHARRGSGLIAVSFFTENANYLAPHFMNWLNGDQAEASDEGKNTALPANYRKKKPSVAGKKGKKVMTKSSSGEGVSFPGESGAAAPGKDLVFRVKAPVKLYWLGRLYDTYDGKVWKESDDLKKQQTLWETSDWAFNCANTVKQVFIIDKWVSNVLFCAYRPMYYVQTDLMTVTEENFYHRTLEQQPYPKTPFSYEAHSRLPYLATAPSPIGESKTTQKTPTAWNEKLPPKHYLELPEGKIGDRVKALAGGIGANIADPYEKALALRDYLRGNYEYNLFPGPLPSHREPVDYFLFQLKQGHCEYFAAALTVLARLNGLPARLATGFSPGDYNALTGFFEVREYHAHAWTQIFIEGKGWLTFDATPPGAISSRTTPLGIGSLRDPFGDEWRVTPPELTQNAQDEIRPDPPAIVEDEKGKRVALEPKQPNALMKLLIMPEGDSANKLADSKKKVPSASVDDIVAAAKANFKQTLRRIVQGWTATLKWVKREFKRALLLGLPLALALFLVGPRLARWTIRRWRLSRCRRMLSAAARRRQTDPKASIVFCYRLTRELLELAGQPRKNNMELFAYGESLKQFDPEISRRVLALYAIYSRAEYSPLPPSFSDARTAFINASEIRVDIAARLKARW